MILSNGLGMAFHMELEVRIFVAIGDFFFILIHNVCDGGTMDAESKVTFF